MVRPEIYLALFLVLIVPIVSFSCGEIFITDKTTQQYIDGLEGCTEATLLHVKYTANLTLKLSKLRRIRAKEPLNNKKGHSIYHRNLIEISHNSFLTWNNKTLPKLELIQPFNESLSKCYTVLLLGNFPFRYTEEINNKLLAAGVQQNMISAVKSRNTCKIANGTVYGAEDCYILSGTVSITGNFSMESELAKRLRNVHTIYGSISISGSNLRNMDLFKKLETIACRRGDCSEYLIEIVNNPYLVEKDYIFYSLKKMQVKNNAVRISNNKIWKVPFIAEYFFESRLANPGESKIIIERNACILPKNGRLDYKDIRGCHHVVGDITINEKTKLDKRFKMHLYLLHRIDGCLTIENLNITDLDFFVELKTVNCTKQRDAIIIRNNPSLNTMTLKITKVYAHAGFNHIRLYNNVRICEFHKNYFMDTLEIVDGPPRVKLDGLFNYYCKRIQSPPKSLYTLLILTLSLFIIPPSLWISIECCKNRKKPTNSYDRA